MRELSGQGPFGGGAQVGRNIWRGAEKQHGPLDEIIRGGAKKQDGGAS